MSRNAQRPRLTFRGCLECVGWLLRAGLVLYLVVCMGCAIFQRRLIYFPPVFTSGQVDQFARAARLERWRNPAGQAIGMKRLSPKQPAEGRVLVVYGNGSCATGCAHYADAIQGIAPFDVFIVEYPGYADRPGSPSQQSLFRAADEAFQLLATNGPVYLVGESLGTGVAAYLAGKYPDKVAGMVLFAPYNRLADVAQAHMPLLPVHLMLVDRFPSEDYLRNYHGPVAVLVGEEDQVVPAKFGRRLYDDYAGPKRLWDFPVDDHGSLFYRLPNVWKQIITFLGSGTV
ncbi:MAG TPA: alpha/beta fold hydrolase [Verrucomicrobiae bacterium]|nr:alpha/beta fold hydrolase [Verrucomicrobiae bacterium]